jgi:hypothetical protein
MNRLTPRHWCAMGLPALVLLGCLLTRSRVPQATAVQPGPVSQAAPLPAPGSDKLVVQGFPAAKFAAGSEGGDARLKHCDTAWKVEWDVRRPGNGPDRQNADGWGGFRPRPTYSYSSMLHIKSASFMYRDRKGQARWINVLRHLELNDAFTPYDDGQQVYTDIHQFNFYLVPPPAKAAPSTWLGPPCVAAGQVLSNLVLKEVHDDGVRWLDGFGRARRGEKMTLWAVFYAMNYRYIIEYGFRDDGVITCRLGATAHNIMGSGYNLDRSVHMHVGCWKWDMDLGDPQSPGRGGPKQNLIQLVRRVPAAPERGAFRVDVRPFPGTVGKRGPAMEGGADWKAAEFTSLRVESKVRKNSNGKPTSYDLIPVRLGSVRHYPQVIPIHEHEVIGGERSSGPALTRTYLDFANHDFWVSRQDKGLTRIYEVPAQVDWPGHLDGHAATIWHLSPMLHVPRAEDFGPDPDAEDNKTGVHITTWSEFMLEPRNLFDGTPLYTPPGERAGGAK